ncbi:MAG TPA: hypothetical protein V6D21_11280 [Candidatus Obscuribacterales bacterium]
MTTFELTSTDRVFVIAARVLEGYAISNGALRLYTEHYPIDLANTGDWDNWDEFVDQIKKRFSDQGDFF